MDSNAISTPTTSPAINVSSVDCDRNSHAACDTDIDMHNPVIPTQAVISTDFINENSENQKKIENSQNPKKNSVSVPSVSVPSVSVPSVPVPSVSSSTVASPTTASNPVAPAVNVTRPIQTYAQATAGDKRTPRATTNTNDPSFQNVLMKFERTFKWASHIKILDFKHRDVLEYAISEKRKSGKLFSTSNPAIIKSKEKREELVKIMEIEDFFQNYTSFNMTNEFNRLRNSRISLENYLEFIMSQQHLKDILIYFKIPKDIFTEFPLEKHLESIKNGLTKLSKELDTITQSSNEPDKDLIIIRENLKGALNHLVIFNKKICLNSNFIPNPQDTGSDIFKKDRNLLIEYLNIHLKVTVGNYTYTPGSLLNTMNKESHLIEIEMNSEFTEFNREKLLDHVFNESGIDPSSFFPINTVHFTEEASKAASIVTYGYIEIDSGKSLPLFNDKNFRSRVITKCVHCTACGSREHTRFDCKTSSCAICKKLSHRAKDCYFKKQQRAPIVNPEDPEKHSPKQNSGKAVKPNHKLNYGFQTVEKRKIKSNKPATPEYSKPHSNPFDLLANEEENVDDSIIDEDDTLEKNYPSNEEDALEEGLSTDADQSMDELETSTTQHTATLRHQTKPIELLSKKAGPY
ncbi:hypothetical protein DASC09_004530 [Saccharomycopsis crataegensis]|uniref:CCHC-type domain-containing protein n=2 Tax=Saccharomycopsis crataegensis TaxID=43959 RepID=A0AAV5QEF0_9ASCO|nr:hypothetical protein DASC09_004530 [Saccharomycopsis crataegensis]